MTGPKIIGVIPARWKSKRFEGKPLVNILGKPMIQQVWERAKQAKSLSQVLIASDDERILKAARQFGAQAVMTRADHASGTDRIAEAVSNIAADIVVNIQGDEPLIRPEVIDQCANALLNDPSASMATVIKIISSFEQLNDPNTVKVVVNNAGDALYFSRAAIPFRRDADTTAVFYKHLGLYAYRREFLLDFCRLAASRLEQIEKLEQLRVLEAGYKIKTVVTEHDFKGVDTPDDLRAVIAALKEENGKSN